MTSALRPISSVAVLGGGISGLSTAYYLSRLLPKTVPITIYEASGRVGGYIESTKLQLPAASIDGAGGEKNEDVLFEHGPRTLRVSKRVSSLNMFDLINSLGMADELIVVPKDSAAARNRYIYYKGRINMIPYSLSSILRFYFSQALFRGMLPEVIREPFRRNQPPKEMREQEDETIGSFMNRRFGPRIADRLMSGVIHGIYAGDIYQLSVRSILEYLWKRERTTGSIIPFPFSWNRKQTQKKDEAETPADVNLYEQRGKDYAVQVVDQHRSFFNRLEGASVVSFTKGMQSIINHLEDYLSALPNVTIKRNMSVTELKNVVDGVMVSTATGESHTYSRVFSAMPARKLAEITEFTAPGLSQCLKRIPSVSVNVVNLFFSKPRLLPVTGFGYLLPRAIPRSDNPERALGVVFDSDTVSKDAGEGKIPGSLQDSVDGTKVTVMLGGHWWDTTKEEGTPAVKDAEEAITNARTLIARQMGVTEEPALAQSTFQESCIPQYVVGHAANLKRIHEAVLGGFGGKVAVVGASYLGVSVNDCVYYSRIAAEDVVAGRRVSGLEASGV
ncbi:hypothetical protein BZA70DRAFT_296892 [Myxozyma melibiosi]|uniref:Protoporphyrinogen oxidase n=1 Tax=Myxozyma melibiosi TaxID=54550 RepID=A0ABR1F129_9ASCO